MMRIFVISGLSLQIEASQEIAEVGLDVSPLSWSRLPLDSITGNFQMKNSAAFNVEI